MTHIPVLLKEIIEYLQPEPGKKFIDATIGGGGHAREIAKLGSQVLGIDQDRTVILNLIQDPDLSSRREISRRERFRLPPEAGKRGRNDNIAVQGNFAELKTIAQAQNFSPVDGILFDLGMGSHQLDDPSRGFAFQKEGPLDMRFDPTSGKSASEVVNFYPEQDLKKIFILYGEERRFAAKIAKAILKTRKIRKLETTTELFELIKTALPGKFRYQAGDTARRIFQALRIFVNEELANLEKVLPQALDLLKLHGRIVVISFHSLEDRIVKRFFLKEAKNCVCPPEFPVCVCNAKARLRILTKKPITASLSETKINPRAKSAKLRVAEKIWAGTTP